MILPKRWLGWLTAVWGVYALVWIGLEGELWQTVALGGSTAVLLAANGWRRWGEKRPLVTRSFLLLITLSGFLIGLFSALFTLFFMALKTGLHAHGPEYTPQEIAWVVQQIPFWAGTGLLSGFGVGLLWLASGRET